MKLSGIPTYNKLLNLTFWSSLRFMHGLWPFLHKTTLQPKRKLAKRYEQKRQQS